MVVQLISDGLDKIGDEMKVQRDEYVITCLFWRRLFSISNQLRGLSPPDIFAVKSLLYFPEVSHQYLF
jgi:hypothetical protein